MECVNSAIPFFTGIGFGVFGCYMYAKHKNII
jgi:hypothetical protein